MQSRNRAIAVFIAIPLVLELALMLAYFVGPDWMSALVASPANREYGLLESAQLALVVLIGVLAFRGGLRARGGAKLVALAWWSLALFALVIALEEVDYGLHWIESVQGTPEEEKAVVRNFHNQPGVISPLKRLVDAGFLTVYGVLPWVVRWLPERLRALVPSRWSLGTLVVALLVSSVAHWFDDRAEASHVLRGNVSEFRELLTYWIAALHVLTMRQRSDALSG